MIVAAALSLLMHVLPPFRPLTQRLNTADAVAIIDITDQKRSSVEFKTLVVIKGQKLTKARLLPGHRPSSKARYGLATSTRRSGKWFIQEQDREWVELQPSEWQMHPLLVWKKWVKGLTNEPHAQLLTSLQRRPFDRYAARDLNALMLIPANNRLRRQVAFALSKQRLAPKVADSLKHSLLKAAPAPEQPQIKRCLLGDKSCLGR